MIKHIGAKIKEYRTKLGITQDQLARKAEVTYVTLTKVESGAIQNPSLPFITKVAKALDIQTEELHDFLPEFDLEQATQILKGAGSIARLLDDVFETLKDSGGEVCVSGVDERKFLDSDRKAIEAHITRLARHNITEKLLARENDSFFFAGTQSTYRWVPENLFNPTPIYVYGDKIAMIVWSDPTVGAGAKLPLQNDKTHFHQIIIIRNLALADAYRKQFLFIWDKAQIPPTTIQTKENERERLEKALLKRFGGRISSIIDKDRELFRRFLQKEKTTTFGNSWYYLCQTANGTGEQKLGLKYFDGDTLIPIGIFNRASLGGGWHYFLNHPLGIFDPKKIISISKSLVELSAHPVFIKKVTTEQKELLLESGCSPIQEYPWHSNAMEEDDTFPEQIIDVTSVLTDVERPGKHNLKNQYTFFLSKVKNKKLEWKNLDHSNEQEAYELVKHFFNYLDIKQLHISAVSDYDNIISHPPLGKNGNTHFAQMLFIDNSPAGFFAIEPISKDTAGLYASITLHEQYPNLSEYFFVYCCKLLKSAGYKYLNLGGSETAGLFQFKEKFSPVQYNKMHWVVYKI